MALAASLQHVHQQGHCQKCLTFILHRISILENATSNIICQDRMQSQQLTGTRLESNSFLLQEVILLAPKSCSSLMLATALGKVHKATYASKASQILMPLASNASNSNQQVTVRVPELKQQCIQSCMNIEIGRMMSRKLSSHNTDSEE